MSTEIALLAKTNGDPAEAGQRAKLQWQHSYHHSLATPTIVHINPIDQPSTPDRIAGLPVIVSEKVPAGHLRLVAKEPQ